MEFWLEWQFDLGMATGHQVIDDMLNSYKQNNSSTVPNISKNKNISKFVDFCIFQILFKNWKVQTTPVGRPLLPVHYLLCKFMDLRWQSYGKETEKKVIKVPWAVPLNDVTGQGLLPLPCSPRWPLIAKWSFFFFLSLFKAMSGGNNKNKSGIIRRWPRSAVTPVTLKFA